MHGHPPSAEKAIFLKPYPWYISPNSFGELDIVSMKRRGDDGTESKPKIFVSVGCFGIATG